MTIGGGNSRGVKVVTEEARGQTDPRQKFWVGAGKTNILQETNSYNENQ
jgi:hypothetical protein